MAGIRVSARAAGRQKALAIAAAGVILLSGVAATSMATWNDTEWVNGGVNGVPGIGTSKFEVEQNVTTPVDAWTNDLASPGGVINFGTLASTLTPGDTVYGEVRLRTQVSSIGGTLTLKADTSVATGLASQLTYGAYLHTTAGSCTTALNFATGTQLVAPTAALNVNSAVPFTLAGSVAGNPGVEKSVCFAITLPAGTSQSYMGLTVDPIWHFDGVSD